MSKVQKLMDSIDSLNAERVKKYHIYGDKTGFDDFMWNDEEILQYYSMLLDEGLYHKKLMQTYKVSSILLKNSQMDLWEVKDSIKHIQGIVNKIKNHINQ